ncbi:hypothetical protein HDU97_009939 [Phlyctochytrium planicorne]|nr:hypothetical protein HDU97_009939 [Phlyctochytrium planicorne]
MTNVSADATAAEKDMLAMAMIMSSSGSGGGSAVGTGSGSGSSTAAAILAQPPPPSSSSSSSSIPKSPVSAAWLAMGVWAKDVGKESVRLAKGLTRLGTTRKASATMTTSTLVGSPQQVLTPVLKPISIGHEEMDALTLLDDTESDTPSDLVAALDDEDELVRRSPYGSLDDRLFSSSPLLDLDLEDSEQREPLETGTSCTLPKSDPMPISTTTTTATTSHRRFSTSIPSSLNRVSVLDLPPELLHQILANLPTRSILPLLSTPAPLSTVSSSALSSRLFSISTLSDLKNFVHCDQGEHKKSIGPLFYRAGTIVLFARYFMRLIPEARKLLGLGYAVVLGWFMCVFYAVPFLGALILYSAMDLVDFVSQIITRSISYLPDLVRSRILPKTHHLHPYAIAHAVPRVPPHLVMKLRFEGPKPVVTPSDLVRCCGPAGSLGLSGEDNALPVFGPENEGIASSTACSEVDEAEPVGGNQDDGKVASGGNQNWGLMSPYTPWHLYLLTYAVSTYTVVEDRVSSEDAPTHSTLRKRRQKFTTAAQYKEIMESFRALSKPSNTKEDTPMASAATDVTVKFTKPVAKVVAVVVMFFVRVVVVVCLWVWGLVGGYGDAVRVWTRPGRRWAMGLVRRILPEGDVGDLVDGVDDEDDEDLDGEYSEHEEDDAHRRLLTATVTQGCTRLILSRVSLAWWFRLHPVPSLRALTLERCEVDENGVSIVAAACQGIVGLILRRCEVRGGDGGWRAREAASVPQVELHQVVGAEGEGPVTTEGGTTEGTADIADASASTDAEANGGANMDSPTTPTTNTLLGLKDLEGIGVFPRLRLVRFELCGGASCGIDAIRMVLERAPCVERVEFVGAGPVEEALLEIVGNVELEKLEGEEGANNGDGVKWFEGNGDVEACVQDRIRRKGEKMVPRAVSGVAASEEDGVVSNSVYGPAPSGYRKCFVVERKSAKGFKDVWSRHMRERQRGLWEGHI